MRISRRRGQSTSVAMRLLPFTLLAFSLISTLGLWFYAANSVEIRDELAFQRRIDQAMVLMEARLDEQVTLLRGTAAMISIDPEMKPRDFALYMKTLGLEIHYPGLLGVGYAYLANDKVDWLERTMQSDGIDNYTVYPKEYTGDQYPIRYLEPFKGRNLRAIGFNMFSEPKRRAAMAKARDTGSPVATQKVILVQDAKVTDEPGFLIYVPIYKTTTTPATLAERRNNIIGFAYSPIRSRAFFGDLLDSPIAPDIGITIYSGKHDPNEQIYYRQPSNTQGADLRHRKVEELDSYGIKWIVEFFAPSYSDVIGGSELVLWIPILGMFVSILLYGAARTQLKLTQESQIQAEIANRRAEREHFLSETSRILSSSLDSRRTIEEVASLAVPSFADVCVIEIPNEKGGLEPKTVAEVDPETGSCKILSASAVYGPSLERQKVFRTGKAFVEKRTPSAKAHSDPTYKSELQALKDAGVHSYICVPMSARGEMLGVMTFLNCDVSRAYDDEDLNVAVQIGSRTALALDNARLFHAAQREIGDRKRAEKQVRDLNRNLERIVDERTKELRATNLELEAFCYSVSHDLRTPLRSVDGFSKALIEDYGDRLPEEGIQYLDRVRKASHRMDELITALLTLSRITRADISREPVDFSSVAGHAAAEASREVAPDNLKVHIQPGMEVTADPRMVRIILDNLISNAIKFSRDRKPQIIDVGREDGVFFVRDNGVGFNPEYKAKLFTPFERLHHPREFPGTGVGLATVQRVVHKHGGEIWAESQEGEGATFYFTLG